MLVLFVHVLPFFDATNKDKYHCLSLMGFEFFKPALRTLMAAWNYSGSPIPGIS